MIEILVRVRGSSGSNPAQLVIRYFNRALQHGFADGRDSHVDFWLALLRQSDFVSGHDGAGIRVLPATLNTTLRNHGAGSFAIVSARTGNQPDPVHRRSVLVLDLSHVVHHLQQIH
jgi:hypothetical protein